MSAWAASSGLPLACNLVRRTLPVAWKPRSTLSQWPGGNGPSRLPRRIQRCRLADPTIWTTSGRPEKPITQPTSKPAKVSCQQSLRIRQGGTPEASAEWRAGIPIPPITACSNWTRNLTLTVQPVVVQMVRHLSRPGLPGAAPGISQPSRRCHRSPGSSSHARDCRPRGSASAGGSGAWFNLPAF
jgi:hypothetical protein